MYPKTLTSVAKITSPASLKCLFLRARAPGGSMDGLLTTEDVARLLGCSPAAVRKWRSQGRLRVVKVGRLVRFWGEDIARVANKGL